MYPFWIHSEVHRQNQSHWHNWGKFSLRVAPSVSGATRGPVKVLIVLAICSSSSSTCGQRSVEKHPFLRMNSKKLQCDQERRLLQTSVCASSALSGLRIFGSSISLTQDTSNINLWFFLQRSFNRSSVLVCCASTFLFFAFCALSSARFLFVDSQGRIQTELPDFHDSVRFNMFIIIRYVYYLCEFIALRSLRALFI